MKEKGLKEKMNEEISTNVIQVSFVRVLRVQYLKQG